MQHHHGRNTSCGQSRQIAKHIAEARPQLHLVLQQVGASRLHQVDDRKFLTHAHLENGRRYEPGRLGRGARRNTRVIDPDHAPNTLNKPNAHNDRGPGDTCFTIGILNAVVGHGVHLQEWHSWIQQPLQAFARRQLTPSPESFQALIRRINGALLERSPMVD